MTPRPLGNLIRDWLEMRGITEIRVNWWIIRARQRCPAWTTRFLPRHCFCGEIRRWLNRNKPLHDFFRRFGCDVRYDDGSLF